MYVESPGKIVAFTEFAAVMTPVLEADGEVLVVVCAEVWVERVREKRRRKAGSRIVKGNGVITTVVAWDGTKNSERGRDIRTRRLYS